MVTINKKLISASISVFALSSLGVNSNIALSEEIVRLDEIVVTAQKRAQSLQDVPISVKAVSGTKMLEAGIENSEDLSMYIPNFQMSEAALGTNIFIRGVGSQVEQGFEQSVGTYMDGIYYGRSIQSRFPFLDLERVEVLRGPQSILFGKNSIAGALNLTSAKPTDSFEGEITALYEPDHGEKETTLILSGPITEQLSGRVAMRYREMDGYLNNKTRDRDESDRKEEAVRGTLRWLASDDLEIILKGEVGRFDIVGRNTQIIENGQMPILISDTDFDQTKFMDADERHEDELENIVLSVNYNIGEHMLSSITGYSAYNFEELTEGDFSPENIFVVPAEEDFEQLSQEIRLTSPLDENFNYIVGAFFQSSELTVKESFDIIAFNRDINRDFNQDSDMWAVFFQGSWALSDKIRLTAGVRYTEEEKDGGRSVIVVDRSTDNVVPGFAGTLTHMIDGARDEESLTPSISLEWDMTPDSMVYASYSTGYKSGGFGVKSGNPNIFEFEEEEAKAYEVGFKSSLLDGKAELNGALFFTQYENLQTSAFDGAVSFNVGNAKEAETKGVEVDGRWRLSRDLSMSGSLAYLDFEFVDFVGSCYLGQQPNASFPTGNPACLYNGKENNYTPEWSASISFDYEKSFAENLIFRGNLDVNFMDNHYTAPDLDPASEQSAYTKLNLRIGIGDNEERWELALIGRNLTDKITQNFANDVPLSGANRAYFAFTERPRSIALQGVYRF